MDFKEILIVFEDDTDQQRVSSLFKRSQFAFTPTFVSSLRAAKMEIEKKKFDIIVLDDVLESDLGYEFILEIRKSVSKDTKILMFSGDRYHISQAISYGAKAYYKVALRMNFKINEELNQI